MFSQEGKLLLMSNGLPTNCGSTGVEVKKIYITAITKLYHSFEVI